MSDLDRLLAQVEELKRLAQRPDDSWMNSMSSEELQALGKRVRKVADGLSGLQNQMIQKNRGASARPASAPRAPAPVQRSSGGSLGNIVRRDSGGAPSGSGGGGMDLSNPMGRGRVGGASIPSEAPPARRPGGPTPQAPRPGAAPPPKSGWKPPWAEQGGNPPGGGGRGRNRPSF
ncbi:MAG: hypothetical protein ACRDJU_11160 [Actinomycetota bacterium]